SEKIARVTCPSFTPGSDVVDLDQIALLKEQFAPTAFPLLLVEQGSQPAHGERMRLLYPLGPIEQVAIKRAGVPFDLDVALNSDRRMVGKGIAIWRGKPPVVLSYRAPIAQSYPAR